MEKPTSRQINSTYELFIAALSALAILNLFLLFLVRNPNVEGVVLIVDGLLSFIFLIDFLYRLFTAESKKDYFVRKYGWADFLSSTPFPLTKALRLFSLTRTGHLARRSGTHRLAEEFVVKRASSTLITLLFLIILVMEFGSMWILSIEGKSADANIKTASDALWYMYVSITTVGYGDRYPVTNSGRLVGIVILALGVGLFGTLTGFLANAFIPPNNRQAGKTSDAEEIATGNSNSAIALQDRMGEVLALLVEQKEAQGALQMKVDELERVLARMQLLLSEKST